LAAKLSSQSDVVDLTDERGLLESLLSSDQVDVLPVDLILRDPARRSPTSCSWRRTGCRRSSSCCETAGS
jgi:hypothetical protein